MRLIDAPLKIKEVTATGSFAGYGSVYGNVDDGGDICAPGCFKDSLADMTRKKRMPALLWQHRPGEPIGVYQKMSEDKNGLYVEGKLALKTQRGAEAYELLQMRAISGLSIGYLTREDSFDQKTGVRTIKKADLWEVSLVTFPMNDAARVDRVKGESLERLADVARYLRDAGSFTEAESKLVVARINAIAQREAGGGDVELLAQTEALLSARIALLRP